MDRHVQFYSWGIHSSVISKFQGSVVRIGLASHSNYVRTRTRTPSSCFRYLDLEFGARCPRNLPSPSSRLRKFEWSLCSPLRLIIHYALAAWATTVTRPIHLPMHSKACLPFVLVVDPLVFSTITLDLNCPQIAVRPTSDIKYLLWLTIPLPNLDSNCCRKLQIQRRLWPSSNDSRPHQITVLWRRVLPNSQNHRVWPMTFKLLLCY